MNAYKRIKANQSERKKEISNFFARDSQRANEENGIGNCSLNVIGTRCGGGYQSAIQSLSAMYQMS